MLVTGIPYTDPALSATHGGATPYGATLVEKGGGQPHPHELEAAERLGARLAKLIKALA